MKSFVAITALAGAALASSAMGAPLAARNIESGSTCGSFVLAQSQYLQVNQANTEQKAILGDDQTNLHVNNVALASYPVVAGAGYAPNAVEFNFQQCGAQGFTQGYSRNHGGSMGAPIEYWGRVVANVTIEYGPGYPQPRCLAAVPYNAIGQKAWQFEFAACNDQDDKQWFRLQQGIGGSQLDYFPLKNTTGFNYDGQTPYHFYDHDITQSGQLVQYSMKPNVQNTVTFVAN